MKTRLTILLAVLVVAFVASIPASAQVKAEAATKLQVNIAPEAYIQILNGPSLFTAGTTAFSPFSAQTDFDYKVRVGSKGAAVTAPFTSDFAGSVSGSVGPRIADGHLQYTASSAGIGKPQPGVVPAKVDAAGTPVLSFAAGDHSKNGGDKGSIAWTLANLPEFDVDTYVTTLTLTLTIP